MLLIYSSPGEIVSLGNAAGVVACVRERRVSALVEGASSTAGHFCDSKRGEKKLFGQSATVALSPRIALLSRLLVCILTWGFGNFGGGGGGGGCGGGGGGGGDEGMTLTSLAPNPRPRAAKRVERSDVMLLGAPCTLPSELIYECSSER